MLMQMHGNFLSWPVSRAKAGPRRWIFIGH